MALLTLAPEAQSCPKGALRHQDSGESTCDSANSRSRSASEEAAPAPVRYPIFVRNTFIDVDIGRPSSLEGFYRERLVRSAPGSGVEPQDDEVSAPPPPAATIRVALAAVAPALAGPRIATGPAELPSLGSSGHGAGRCKPCAFAWKDEGCANGESCVFCHLCDPGEKKRRQKEKRTMRSSIRDFRRALTDRLSNVSGARQA